MTMQQQQQQMYQRMAGGMYNGPHGLTLVQGSNMGPRMVYSPVGGQTAMTTQHSGAMMMTGPQTVPSRAGLCHSHLIH